MRSSILFLVVTALALPLRAAEKKSIPLPDPQQKWIRASSPNFTIVSSASEERTRQIASTLETVAGALRKVHPRFDARFTDTMVFVFSRRRDSQPYFELLLDQPGTMAPGAFIVQPDGTAAIVVDSTRPLATDRTVKHELMHNILASSGTRLPLWLEEGIAEYFSTTLVRGNSVTVGRPIIAHQMSLRARGVLPTGEFLAARHGSPIARHILFYPQSWGIVDWMMRTNRQSFYKFVADVEQGAGVPDTFRKHYSLDIGAVSRILRVGMRPSASSSLQIERTDVEISTASIAPADALYELGMFLTRMRDTHSDAEHYLRAALDLDSRHARAIAGIGALRGYEQRYREAEAAFEEALAITPGDTEILLSYATSLLRNAIGPYVIVGDRGDDAPDRFRRARKLTQAVLTSNPSPLAEAIAGITYLAEHDVTPGIAHLEKAHRSRPGRIDFALNLYAAYVRADLTAQAAELFERVFGNTHDPHVLAAAQAVFVREMLARASHLVETQRLEEGITLIRETIAATSDPAMKARLKTEADRLTDVADTNRHIVAYNQAVDAFNHGDHAAALQHLDRILNSAADRQIRERATRLRDTVRKRTGMFPRP